MIKLLIAFIYFIQYLLVSNPIRTIYEAFTNAVTHYAQLLKQKDSPGGSSETIYNK